MYMVNDNGTILKNIYVLLMIFLDYIAFQWYKKYLF